ncbi:YciI family protein [Flavihumibacter petaseus]|uniref:YCII-related domain-containing protein n=1 Tax=Flavihumibacter petaseus NBRC 106054 TaxID=1220578 RepID=A0A0E9MWD8_9BACT|nr:YciI family protein [Flavihumibacter petaseus]GAO41884.1 hypothetical protein FPE01S_01_08990 [Flavihumibacter petaseus NBRC 106054]
MEEYLILMRLDLLTREAQPSPEQLQEYMKTYQQWVAGIQARQRFRGGKGLSTEGRVIRHRSEVTDGPFVEIKESLAGFITVAADSWEEALEMASQCPILDGDGNSVELRKVVTVPQS